MVELVAKSPCDGLLPVTIGAATLCEEPMARLTSIMPFNGKADAVARLLDTPLPQPNRTSGKAGDRLIWFGQNQYLLMGPDPDPQLNDIAATTDQSDAWTVVRLEGDTAEAILARLVPIDLRASQFKLGHTARTQLQHMMASITRTGPQAFSIMVFRSMAATLVHDLKTAMEGVAARG